MNSSNESSFFLECIGKQVGIDLSFDENNQCFLLIDNKFPISIRNMETHYLLYAMIAEIPSDEDGAIWQNILCLNLELAEHHDGSLGFEETSNSLVLLKNINNTGLNEHEITDAMAKFIFIQESLTKVFLLLEEEISDEEIQIQPANFIVG